MTVLNTSVIHSVPLFYPYCDISLLSAASGPSSEAFFHPLCHIMFQFQRESITATFYVSAPEKPNINSVTAKLCYVSAPEKPNIKSVTAKLPVGSGRGSLQVTWQV